MLWIVLEFFVRTDTHEAIPVTTLHTIQRGYTLEKPHCHIGNIILYLKVRRTNEITTEIYFEDSPFAGPGNFYKFIGECVGNGFEG